MGIEVFSKQGLCISSGKLPVYSRWAHIKRKSSGVFPLWPKTLGASLPRAESVTEFRLRLWVSRYLEFVSKQGLWLRIVADALFLDAWEDIGRVNLAMLTTQPSSLTPWKLPSPPRPSGPPSRWTTPRPPSNPLVNLRAQRGHLHLRACPRPLNLRTRRRPFPQRVTS